MLVILCFICCCICQII